MNRPLNVVFAGTPQFSVPALQALHDWCKRNGHRLVGVLTQPDRPAGRGRKLNKSAVKLWAEEHGIEIDQPRSLRTAEGRQALVSWHPDLLVVAAYGLLLPAEVLDLPTLGCINIHASELPRWRGAAPIQRAILAGDTTTAVCIMQMDEGLDTGAIWSVSRVPISTTETGGTLHDKLSAVGARALVDTLPDIIAGTRQPQKQNDDGATYAAKLTKQEARIDWQDSAATIERQVRAFDPWPVAYTLLNDRRIRIFNARVLHCVDTTTSVPGTVIDTTDGLRVATGDGILDITKLQPAGGKRMEAAAFLNANECLGRRFS
ncbi:MAG: methionyl-tRNA formyltransferase [Gammaproteobacteria bacterium]|nr:methionyl-tRNA formyltransferase [Gammaproteobacteria bacterium]